MTAHEAAAELNGSEIGKEGSQELWARMAEDKLVAVFGDSDDVMVLQGAEDDEVGCYRGGSAGFTPAGLLRNECEGEDCPYFKCLFAAGVTEVKAVWNDRGPEPAWTYQTDIPHATFEIMEDGEVWCRGIVFSLADVPVKT